MTWTERWRLIAICLFLSFGVSDAFATTPSPSFEPDLEATVPKAKLSGRPPFLSKNTPEVRKDSAAPRLFVGLAGIGEMFARVAKNADGSGSGFGAFYAPALLVSGRIALTPGPSGLLLSPWLGWTPFGSRSVDGGSRTTLIPVAVNLAYPVHQFDLKAGIASIIRVISGSGGKSVQRNGTSESVFALPYQSQATNLLALDIGATARVQKIRVDLDFLVTGLLSKRRAVDVVIGAGYGLL